MAQWFAHAPLFPSFRNFGNEFFMNMMKTVAGENEFSTLKIENLKAHVNAEHNALMKSLK